MLGRLVQRKRLLEVRPGFRDASRDQQRNAHQPMSDQKRYCRSLLLGKRQDLRRKLAQHIAIKCVYGCDPGTVEGREQKQRVFDWFVERLCTLD